MNFIKIYYISCKFINIQQSTKTIVDKDNVIVGVSLSISNRVLKPEFVYGLLTASVSLSISNRVLKPPRPHSCSFCGVSLSISNRVLKPAAMPFIGTHSVSLSISNRVLKLFFHFALGALV